MFITSRIIGVFSTFLLLMTISPAFAATTVNGTISSNTTWTAAASPYYVGASVTVATGVTLTLEPGTVVKFAQSQALLVNGVLNASGTSGQQITFTDYRDDSVGGDTNGDGTLSSPAPGWWRGIELGNGGAGILAYCNVRYGGESQANLYKTGAGNLSVTNCTISNSGTYGIYLNAATSPATISNSTISSNPMYGLYAFGNSPATVSGNTFTSNGRYGMYANVSAPPTFSVTGNSFSSNGVAPIGVTAPSTGIAVATDNSFSGRNYVHIEGGTIASNQAWGNTAGALVYFVAGNITLNTGNTLTVHPKTVVKFASGQGLLINGALSAVATTGNEIHFTDLRDDTVGGDSNGDGTASSPAPGWWRGIEINNFGTANLNYCALRYGGGTGSTANLYKTGTGDITVTNSTFSNSNAYGLYLNAATGTLSLSGNTFTGNLLYGVYALGATVTTINGSTFINNTRYGVYANVAAPASFAVSGSSFSGNGLAPIGVTAASSGIAVAADNSFTGRNYVYIEGGTVSSSQSWGTVSDSRLYYVSDNVTIAANQTLTVRPRTVVKFAPGKGLLFNGSLSAVGTVNNNIYFTDFRDDAVGGDSNGDGTATAPLAGGWRGVELNNYATATLDYCVIRYGGGTDQIANLYKTGEGNVSVSNSTFTSSLNRGISLINTTGVISVTTSIMSNNPAYGFYLSGVGVTPAITKSQISGSNVGIYCASGANPVIGGSTENANDIFNNIAYGVQNTATSPTVNATYNWWGSANGPKPGGSGNTISNYVDAANFLTASVFGNTPSVPGAPVTTIPGGNIAGNTTWTLANSPYYISGDVTVNAGVTLTIQPGVVLKFAQNIGLHVNGTLNASGTVDAKIAFTDLRDDTVGGDTNGDGSATIPIPGWWRGINVNAGGSATLNQCVVRYAGAAEWGYSAASVYKTGAGNLTVTDSSVSFSGNYGMYLNGATGTNIITGNTLNANGLDGLEAIGNSPATVSGNTFTGNLRYGIYAGVTNPATFAVSGNSFSYNGTAPIAVSAAGSGIAVAASNTYTGTNYIYVEGGTISSSQTWGNNFVSTYYLAGDVTVALGPTLTITPGTIVKSSQNAGLHIAGILNASGTADNKIYFTDIRDDAFGGDSNNDGSATVPRPGWWRGINVNAGGSATLNQCVVRYAGAAEWGYSAASVYKAGAGSLSVTNSVVSYSQNYGVYLNDASTGSTLTGNSFISNGSDGIYASGNSPATISNNTFTANSRYGIYSNVVASAAFTISGNTFSANLGTPIRMTAVGSGATVSDDNVFTGPLVVEAGDIGMSLSWSGNFIYYVIGNVNVPAGATLTVPAGRIVKFAQYAHLTIYGTLSAVGTADKRIIFTDYRDDSSGGDTNGDGSATTAASDWWYGLRFLSGGAGVVDYATIRYVIRSADYGPIYKTGTGNVSLTNSIIEQAAYNGVYFKNSTGIHTISNNTVQNSSDHGILLQTAGTVTVSGNTVASSGVGNPGMHGLYIDNTPADIINNTVSGSGGYGLYITGAALPALVKNNTLNGNGLGGVGMAADSSGAVIDADNTFSGPIHLEPGSLSRDTAWVSDPRIYYLRGNITVNSGTTLTVPAGRIVKFGQNIHLIIYGTLSAVGTADKRIIFTDYRDDSSGGDTNGDGSATTAASDWWYGLRFLTGGAGVVDYATIRYVIRSGGYGPIYKTGTGNVSLSNSIIEQSAYIGVLFENSTGIHTISNNTIQNSTDHGIRIQGAGGAMTINGNKILRNGIYGVNIENSGSYVNLNANTVELNANSGIYIGNSSPLIQGNIIRYNTNYGIYATGATTLANIFKNTIFANNIGVYCTNSANPLIGGSTGNGNNIFGNTSYGVQNTTAAIEVDASFNWWGNATGPYHSTNPTGTGNAVSDYVYFWDFLSTPAVPLAVEQVMPASRAFGKVPTATISAAQVFTVTNLGTENLVFSSISLTGTDPAEFQITQDLCTGKSLGNNGSCTISVVYAPTRSGPAQAALTIVSNDIYTPIFNAPLTGAGSVLLPFRDDFTGGVKSADWTILNEDAAFYNLADKDGSLTIRTTPTDLAGSTNNIKNLFIVPLPSGVSQFVATAKMLFPTRPSQNFQQGGIVLLAEKDGAPDLDNYLRTEYMFMTGGRRFETTYDTNGTPTSYQGDIVSTITTSTPVWLRIVRQGTEFRAEYSLNGSSYTLIKTLTGPWDISYVGLHALHGDQSTATSIPVEFDYFEVYELPAVAVTPTSAAFGTVAVGSTQSTPFTIANSGPGPLKVSAITVNGTDAAMFNVTNGNCGTLPAAVSAGSSCTFNVTFTPASGGYKTANVHVSTNDINTPVTTLALTGTGLPYHLLNVSFVGTGQGTVTILPDNIACNTNCNHLFPEGTPLALQMRPAEYCLFQGWSDACTGTGNCAVTMNSAQTVTASFDIDTQHMVRIDGTPPIYKSNLQTAFDDAPDESTVQAWALEFSELPFLMFNSIGTVNFQGGYNESYTGTSDLPTVLKGVLKVLGGRLNVKGLVIR